MEEAISASHSRLLNQKVKELSSRTKPLIPFFLFYISFFTETTPKRNSSFQQSFGFFPAIAKECFFSV